MGAGRTVGVMPADVDCVEADKVLEVEQHCGQTVELVGQPEVCEPHVVKRSRHYAELEGRQNGKN